MKAPAFKNFLYLCLFSACSDIKLHFSFPRIKGCCLSLLFCHSLCCLLSCPFTVISCAMKRSGWLQKQPHWRAALGCWAQEHPMLQEREAADLWVPVLGWGRECYCWAAARRKNKLACGRWSWYKPPCSRQRFSADRFNHIRFAQELSLRVGEPKDGIHPWKLSGKWHSPPWPASKCLQSLHYRSLSILQVRHHKSESKSMSCIPFRKGPTSFQREVAKVTVNYIASALHYAQDNLYRAFPWGGCSSGLIFKESGPSHPCCSFNDVNELQQGWNWASIFYGHMSRAR